MPTTPQQHARDATACRRFRRLMDRPGPDLTPEERDGLEEHRGRCPGCRDLARRQGIALEAVRRAVEGWEAGPAGPRRAGALAPERRRALLDRATRRPARGRDWLPILVDPRRALAGAAAATVLVTLTVVLAPRLPGWERGGPEPGPAAGAAAVAPALQVSMSGDAVVLRWSASDDATPHRVVRATDPRQVGSAPAEVVRGSSWVDPHSNGAQIVFYRVDPVDG